MAKTTWKDYFTFSKGERISVYILLGIISLSVVGPYYYSREFAAPVMDTALQRQLDAVLQNTQTDSITDSGKETREHVEATEPAKLFYFDPNELDASGFKKLGLRDKTVQTIINYRNKGGYFKEPGDIRKIYGLREDEADRLIPYIRIEQQEKQPGKDVAIVEKEQSRLVLKKIDINTATEEDFKALPGIGDVLSKRIVKFRNSMHGFKSVNDIGKTYGLSDSVFGEILPYLTISGE